MYIRRRRGFISNLLPYNLIHYNNGLSIDNTNFIKEKNLSFSIYTELKNKNVKIDYINILKYSIINIEILKFLEKCFNFNINIFFINKSKIQLYYGSEMKEKNIITNYINLLYIHLDSIIDYYTLNGYFIPIKDLSKVTSAFQFISKGKVKKIFCNNCLVHFHNIKKKNYYFLREYILHKCNGNKFDNFKSSSCQYCVN